ncbi:putative Sel1 domain-containing protein [Magnetofaba australis IT-1]|uniref:Putative Sel1 domain-containing protein n=1 Tax=Magnetofaba australis IT-1 TaxID=1434232 RepID=A0A1Y2K2N4_9PROT|nr:putative Sel1 domain-containing protein [Magnetofaba australis IT-1]
MAAERIEGDPVQACDRLAASPYDPTRAAEGVVDDEFDAAAAEQACRQALETAPKEPRILFQLGRALAAQRRFPEAKDVLERAADASHAAAQYALSEIFLDGALGEGYHTRGMALLRRAAVGENAKAQYALGLLHISGAIGAPRNTREAVGWLRQSAMQNYAPAQFALGRMLYMGRGVRADRKAAFRWLEKSAKQNYADAQLALASMYNTGKGAPKDPEQTLYWLRRATDNGHPDAKRYYDQLLRQSGAQADNAKTAPP